MNTVVGMLSEFISEMRRSWSVVLLQMEGREERHGEFSLT